MPEDPKSQPRKATVRQLAYKIKGLGQTPNPRFSFFLGAGASIDSGIPLAGAMIRDFCRRITQEQCPEACSDAKQQQAWLEQQPWYEKAKKDGTLYSELFEMCEGKERGRQLYVEQMIEGKKPSFGYVVLANLMARNYINTVITTNFDDLVYNACSTFTEIRPVVYAYGTMVSDFRIANARPKILKLHGDYLYSKLKNSEGELAHQDPNMSRHVGILLNEYGLVVIGYSGCDQSVMDMLRKFPPNNDLYWCGHAGSPIPEAVRSLLVDVDGFYVEVTGFDQMMNEIRSILGFDVPKMLGSLEARRDDIIERLKTFPQTISGLGSLLREIYEFRQNEAVERQQKSRKEEAFLHYVNAYEAWQKPDLGHAEAEFRASLELQADDAYARIALAGVLSQKGNYDEAEEQLEKALPGAAAQALINAQLELGYLYMVQGKHAQSLEAYLKVIQLDPQTFAAHNGAGVAYMHLGQLELASLEFRKSTELNPALYYPAFNWASVLGVKGDFTESQRWWTKALSLWQPLDAIDPYNHAVIQACLGKTEESIQEMRQAIERGAAGLANLVRQSVQFIQSGPAPAPAIAELRKMLEQAAMKEKTAAAVQ